MAEGLEVLTEKAPVITELKTIEFLDAAYRPMILHGFLASRLLKDRRLRSCPAKLTYSLLCHAIWVVLKSGSARSKVRAPRGIAISGHIPEMQIR